MYNKETLNRWNMTEEECDKAIRAIRIPEMRLTYDEKEELLFHIKEFGDAPDDYETLRGHVEFSRKMAKEMEEDKKLVREFVKEWRRLERKYDSFEFEDKSLDELTEMWMNNYFELYFMADKFELIQYYGAKEYAQLYCYNVGICPDSEVSMWRD